MKCNVCNAELKEEQSFCPYCGTKIEKQVEFAPTENNTEAVNVSVSEQKTEQPVNENSPADKFALIGLILGICSLVCCCIGLPSGIAGIILSAKGLQSKTRKGMAIPGLILSILSVVNCFSFWVGFAQGLEIFEYSYFMF